MGHRINGELVDGLGFKPDNLASTPYQDMVLFNFMIGNGEWKLDVQKNLKLVKHKNKELLTIVPYDFDCSKMVSPDYLNLTNPTYALEEDDPVFSKTFKDKVSLEQTIQKFKGLEKNEFSNFKSCELLNKGEKYNMKALLKNFFKTINNKKKVEGMFLGKNIN